VKSEDLKQEKEYEGPLPLISIVTPSFNQGRFIEETIRSVLLQGYPRLEYIIIDGGSIDETLSILAKYEKFLSFCISEKDRGQSHAINKGFRFATGQIYSWLNSDDYLAPGALMTVATEFNNCIDKAKFWLVGNGFDLLEMENRSLYPRPLKGQLRAEELRWSNPIVQPAVFWSSTFDCCINEALHFVLDWDLWNRLINVTQPRVIDNFLAINRMYPANKTMSGHVQIADELYKTALKYGNSPLRAFLYRYALWEPQYRGAGRPIALSTVLPKIWRKIGSWTVVLLCGRKALRAYGWNFCA